MQTIRLTANSLLKIALAGKTRRPYVRLAVVYEDQQGRGGPGLAFDASLLPEVREAMEKLEAVLDLPPERRHPQ